MDGFTVLPMVISLFKNRQMMIDPLYGIQAMGEIYMYVQILIGKVRYKKFTVIQNKAEKLKFSK